MHNIVQFMANMLYKTTFVLFPSLDGLLNDLKLQNAANVHVLDPPWNDPVIPRHSMW